MLESSEPKVALAADTWSPKVCRGYVTVTAHWIDDAWIERSNILKFNRFRKPHTGEAGCAFLYEVLIEWDLYCRV